MTMRKVRLPCCWPWLCTCCAERLKNEVVGGAEICFNEYWKNTLCWCGWFRVPHCHRVESTPVGYIPAIFTLQTSVSTGIYADKITSWQMRASKRDLHAEDEAVPFPWRHRKPPCLSPCYQMSALVCWLHFLVSLLWLSGKKIKYFHLNPHSPNCLFGWLVLRKCFMEWD